MENELEFAASALAMTFVARALITILVAKGLLSEDECSELFDHAQFSLERQQGVDVPANAEVWRIGRNFLEYLATHPVLSDTVTAGHAKVTGSS
jgi:hypothetical protein